MVEDDSLTAPRFWKLLQPPEVATRCGICTEPSICFLDEVGSELASGTGTILGEHLAFRSSRQSGRPAHEPRGHKKWIGAVHGSR